MKQTPGLITLQHFTLSAKKGVPYDLYYRGSRILPSKNGIVIDRGGVLDLATYFNLFSWDKWSLYTGLESLSLIVDIKGSCVVTIHSLDENAQVLEESVTTILSSGEFELAVPERMFAGKLAVQIEAKSPCMLISATWSSAKLPFKHSSRIAAVFCTFNRDEYLFENLNVLKDAGMDNLDVLIVDNASRIEQSKITELGDGFRLFHNPNVGGSGGFTRGIMEALKSRENYSHVLLMDDDIRIEAEAVRRSGVLLSCLKPEYDNHFLSGGMMQLDKPHMMFESTARWNGMRVKNYYKDLDLTEIENLCSSDQDMKANNKYAAWWYCGIPLKKDMDTQLPFPFFIYGDDMDYSLKRASGFITMNGIAVWHEPFTKKFSPLFKSYFFCRNTLILNSLHHRKFSVLNSLVNAWSHFYVQIFVHDYRSASLALDAFDDFLEGAEYVTALNEMELLKDKNMPTDFRKRSREELKDTYRIPASFRRWYSPWYFLHGKLAVYSHDEVEAEIRSRNWKEIIILTLRFWKLNLSGLYRYYPASRSYRNLQRSTTFWQNRLDTAQGQQCV